MNSCFTSELLLYHFFHCGWNILTNHHPDLLLNHLSHFSYRQKRKKYRTNTNKHLPIKILIDSNAPRPFQNQRKINKQTYCTFVCLQNHYWLCSTLPKFITSDACALRRSLRSACEHDFIVHPKEAQIHFHRLFH